MGVRRVTGSTWLQNLAVNVHGGTFLLQLSCPTRQARFASAKLPPQADGIAEGTLASTTREGHSDHSQVMTTKNNQ
eukprot:1143404-Pelagomonas_calceolata.AAC.6